MLSSAKNAVFAKTGCPFLPELPSVLVLFILVLLLAQPCASAEGNALDEAVRQLVERVAAIPNLHGPVRLQIQLDANLAAGIGDGWQDILRSELDKRRLNSTDAADATLLRVGLVETPTQLVLSATARVADREEVRLVSIPRAALLAANLPVVPVRIERQLVYESPEKILDASSLPNSSEGGMAILAYRTGEWTAMRLNSTGEVTQTVQLPIESTHTSRDPHGEITIQTNEAEILLPGKSCKLTWAAHELKCHSAKTVWRSATVLMPSCDAGEWKLQTDGTDWTAAAVLQFIPEGAAPSGSPPLLSDFPGPILNLNAQEDLRSALVVTRNLRTGNYEVYKITLACGN